MQLETEIIFDRYLREWTQHENMCKGYGRPSRNSWNPGRRTEQAFRHPSVSWILGVSVSIRVVLYLAVVSWVAARPDEDRGSSNHLEINNIKEFPSGNSISSHDGGTQRSTETKKKVEDNLWRVQKLEFGVRGRYTRYGQREEHRKAEIPTQCTRWVMQAKVFRQRREEQREG